MCGWRRYWNQRLFRLPQIWSKSERISHGVGLDYRKFSKNNWIYLVDGRLMISLGDWRMGFKSPIFFDEINCNRKMFKLSSLDSFGGYEDPRDHVRNCWAKMELHAASEVLGFLTTLKSVMRIWFNRLQPGSIRSFEQLAMAFLQIFATSRMGINFLTSLQQNFRESIRDFSKRFVKEISEAKNVDQAITIAVVTEPWDFED